MSELEAWVRRTQGLETGTERHLLQEARARAERLRISERELVNRLERDPAEAQCLLSHAVPPETWLFRHGTAFEHLRSWMAVRAQVPLRLASLGCATGAEAFSMAATAASVGRLGPDLRIVALDRNEAALRRAAAGRVSALGQRSPLPTWAGRWFEPTADGGLSLHADAMKLIDWSAADALTADLGGPFDVVMCRNLAIYLDASRRERLRERLADLVRPGGLLFVGHADPESIWHGAFRWLDVPGAFAFERVSAGERHPSRMVDHAGPTAVPLPPAEPAATASPSLDTIRAQADAGELDAAHAGVTRWLTQHPLQAEAWWLCAGIELAKGRSAEAANCLDRVLYLDPMHSLALLQSSELAERRGDRHAAERLRHRARRALAREEQA